MRLNCGIPVEYLTDEHLFAEQRELKMLPSLFKRIGFSSIQKAPKVFTLGTGHMLFGAYRPTYTLNRYNQVFKECIKRGYKIEYEGYRWDVYGDYKDDYKETGSEKYILIERIEERIINSTKQYFHYNHKRISKEEAIKLIKLSIL
jgi:hypothetical protein